MFKLKTIILSRFTKTKEDEETLRRRKICKSCEFNSLNVKKIPRKKRMLKKISDFYSWITGNSEEDNLGNCLACEACSLYFKTAEILEECKKGYWDKNK